MWVLVEKVNLRGVKGYSYVAREILKSGLSGMEATYSGDQL